MKIISKSARPVLTGALSALLSIGVIGVVETGLSPASADGAECPFCSLDVLPNTTKQDNETVLKQGRKQVKYRCVYCALADAGTEYKGDLTVIAPSEKRGKPVILKRAKGKWSASPASVVFVAQRVSHRHCQTGYRALTSKAAFAYYVKSNKKLLGDAKPLSLAQMLAISK